MIGRRNTGLMLAGILGLIGASVDDFIPSKYKPKHQEPQSDQEKAERDLSKLEVIKFEIETIKRGEWVR